MIGLVEGSTFEVVNAANGQLLYSYVLPSGSLRRRLGGLRAVLRRHASAASLYAFGQGSAPATPPADPNCPTGFTCQDINNPAKGSEQSSGGNLTVTAAGTDIKGTGDQFRFISQPVTGDSQTSAQLVSQAPQAGLTQQAGLMVRQTAAISSPFYAVLDYPNDSPPDLKVLYRSTWAKNPTLLATYPVSTPVSVMIQRQGNLFSAGVSADGTNYTLIPGTTADVDLPTTTMQGIAVASGSSSPAIGTATFSNITVGAAVTHHDGAARARRPVPVRLDLRRPRQPHPAGRHHRLGQLADAVRHRYRFRRQLGLGALRLPDGLGQRVDQRAGHHPVRRVRQDPGRADDAGQRQPRPRRCTASTSTPAAPATIQWRVNDGIKYMHTIPLTSVTSPAYLEIVRWQDSNASPPGTYFSTLTSTDGSHLDARARLHGRDRHGLGQLPGRPGRDVGHHGRHHPGDVRQRHGGRGDHAPGLGLPDRVHLRRHRRSRESRPATSCTATATGRCRPAVTSGPSTTSSATPTSRSPAASNANGDGTVSARVDSQSGGGPWMRSGVMIRSGTDPQAPYYGVFATPQHGVVVQWRASQAAQTSQLVGPATSTPVFVEASRYTDTAHNVVYYSAYTSTDGVNWTYVPGSTVALNLPGPLVAGLASDANSSTNLTTATFDSFAQGPPQAPPNLCPSAWTCTDIGGPLPPGTDSSPAARGTKTGGGGDIWGTADSFHFVSQTLAADGTVTAHVTAQQNTSAWAKAGRDGAGDDRSRLAVLRGLRHAGQRDRGAVAHCAGRIDQPGGDHRVRCRPT